MKKILIGSLLLGGLYLFYRKNVDDANELVDSVQFNPSNISIDTTYLLSPKVFLIFQVNNPTTTTIQVTKIFGTIKSGNNPDILATINNNEVITIQNQGTTEIPVQINLNAIQIAKDIYSGKIDSNLIVEGYAYVGIVKIPFKQILEWPL